MNRQLILYAVLAAGLGWLIKRIDRYAQQGWSGDVIPHLVAIEGDIYAQSIE